MRAGLTAVLVAGALAAAGCMGHGCEPSGEGEVVWHQPGAFHTARAAAGAQVYWTTPNPWPLTDGHPLQQKFGNATIVQQVSWDEGEGGASVPLDVRPTFVHAGGNIEDLRRAVVNLARHLAADPSEVDAWAARHRVGELDTRSDPTPLDLELNLESAAAEAAAAPVVEVQPYQLTIRDGPVGWTLSTARVEVEVPFGEWPRTVSVLGGDWVRSPFVHAYDDVPGDREAEAEAVQTAASAGIPDGPRDSVQVQHQLVCG